MLEIHSRKSQGHRNKVSDTFRNGQGLVMFTSDVSARGMDYPDVSAVLQVTKTERKIKQNREMGGEFVPEILMFFVVVVWTVCVCFFLCVFRFDGSYCYRSFHREAALSS